MLRKILLTAVVGAIFTGVRTTANAQVGSTYDYLRNSSYRSTVGPFTQPFERRCGVVGRSRDGSSDMVLWSVSRSAVTACNSAIGLTKSKGYVPIGFYEVPSELSGRGLQMARPRTQPSNQGICFAQPGESCY